MTNVVRVHAYIDADNVSADYARQALSHLSSRGRVHAKAYGNFAARSAKWKTLCLDFGIEIEHRYQVARTKNAADIALVVDAVECLHQGWGPDFIAILSSDSDFLPLVQRIRGSGIATIGFGESKAPESLKNAYDEWIPLDAKSTVAA